MKTIVTDPYVKACMKAWLLCESCVHVETSEETGRTALIEKCRVCANSCFSLVSGMISEAGNWEGAVMDCLLACRECSEECAIYDYVDDIDFCGQVCGNCAELMKELMPVYLN